MPESKRLEDARSIAIFCQEPECSAGPYAELVEWVEHWQQQHAGVSLTEPLVWYED